ncbi:hypothetical protein DW019_01505 [Clostridium sp. AF37-5]|jgi:hypothetical protein|uniref:hypothetical protein n=1 Tax=Clostridium sp. AF37-5 TaxID=2293016 RepID=UPI000E4F49F2|nr:hypothetical protein [Clostridium sp. AF37-5]RHO99255.1 hypothetical protein DW019_01505 [Clostridium sp. AF37-5]
MRICNNTDGLLECGGECDDNGLCQSKHKCVDSLVFTQNNNSNTISVNGTGNVVGNGNSVINNFIYNENDNKQLT